MASSLPVFVTALTQRPTRAGCRRAAFLALTLFAGTARAQWTTENYALKGGWNSIYLHGDASHTTPAGLFASGPAASIMEIWRWNPNQVQFTTTPLLPLPGTAEWSVWYRDNPGTAENENAASTLTALTGQSAYLIKCAGAGTDNYSVAIPQRPLPPASTWVRNDANFLGFPTRLTADYPTFSSYFATFPAAVAANSKIYCYVGGELSATNPLQLFSPATERVDRTRAYWFESEVVGNFYAPVQVTLSKSSGMDFGRTGALVTARVMNRTSVAMTLTIAPVASNAPPAGQEVITGQVPVTRRTFNTGTAAWEETLIQTSYTEVVPPQGAVELSFGIDRNAMAGAAEAFFASMLRFTDAVNQFEILIPATARKGSLAGLWIGDAMVNAVESKAQADAVKPTGRGYPLRYILHVADDGTARVLSQVFLGRLAAPPNHAGLCTKESGLKADAKAEATRLFTTHMPLDRVLDGAAGSGGVAIPGTLTRTISLPLDDPTNPFVHQYHPDHDNKSATGAALTAGKESYDITREVTFTFTASPPAGSTVTTGWGSSVIGGTYAEVIQGLHKDTAGVGTGNGLQLSGTFELRRISELGAISVAP